MIMKKKYTAPSCEIIECDMQAIMTGSDQGNITINKDPYEGELNSKTDYPGIWDDDEPAGSSLWDEY